MNSNLSLIVVCLILGHLLRRTKRFPDNAPKAFSGYVIHVALPALIMTRIPDLLNSTDWGVDCLIPIAMPWIVFLGSATLFAWLGERKQWPRATTGAILLGAGLGNTSFVGIPIVEAYLGSRAVPIALLIDQVGTYLVLSSLGIAYASLYSPRHAHVEPSWAWIARRIGTFPPLVSLCLATAMWALEVRPPGTLPAVLERLGATLVPLALVSVGFQLNISRTVLRDKWTMLTMGLSYKLIYAPFLCLALFHFVVRSNTLGTHVTILESAMAPQFAAAVVAEEFDLDSELTSLMLGVGIPLSLVTVFLWESVLLSLR